MKIIKKFSQLNTAQLTIVSFLILIFIGTILLLITERNTTFSLFQAFQNSYNTDLSLSKYASTGLKITDALFLAVSAICVTGLVTVDFNQLSFAGQVTILALVQIGGVGIILFASIIAMNLIRGLSEKMNISKILADVLETKNHAVSHMVKHVLTYTLVLEFLGFISMYAYYLIFKPEFYDNSPFWWSIFHSISAFNSSGFSLMGDNLIQLQNHPILLLIFFILMLSGALGYPVLIFIHSKAKYLIFKKNHNSLEEDVKHVVASKVQVRIALTGFLSTIFFSTILIMLIQDANYQQFVLYLFQVTSSFTAGFTVTNITTLYLPTTYLFMLMMFVGGNPAGTAGGIKFPTIVVLYGYLKDWFKKPGQPVKIMGRNISKFAVSHAIRLFFGSIIFTAFITFLITLFEKNNLLYINNLINLDKIIFEVFAAYSTVGLTLGFPGSNVSFSAILSESSKMLLVFTMLMGRIGLLTILSAMPFKEKYNDLELSRDFPDSDKIQIG